MNTGLFHFTVTAAQDGVRLDRAIADAGDVVGIAISRTRVQRLIAEGHVTVDGIDCRQGKAKVHAGAAIAVAIPPPRPAEPIPQAIPLAVVFEDEHLLVLDKQAGLVVHPAAGHEDGTLVNALMAHCGDSLSGIGGVRRPGIVHRLDKDTSGLMVVAKSDAAHVGLSGIFADHGRSGSLVREYLAVVWGASEQTHGTVESSLGRDPHNRLKIAVVAPGKGRHAVTHWWREESFGAAASLIRCRLETGRTHQIRVHMTGLGHPLIGDDVYGAGFRTKAARLDDQARIAVLDLGRQALHAAVLGFAHPVSGAVLRFESAIPDDMQRLRLALTPEIGPA